MTNSVGEKLRTHWLSLGLSLPRGSTEVEIRNFESRYSVRLPPDFMDYFLHVNGMASHWPNAQDPEGYSFWPLERIKTVPEEATNHQYGNEWSSFPDAEWLFLFADYLDWSWAYAIQLSADSLNGNPLFIIAKQATPIEVAGSFTEFVELYLADSPALYGVGR